MNILKAQTIRLGSIRNVSIDADIMLLPALITAYLTGGMEFLMLTLPVFIVHELTHIFAAYLFDCRLTSFTLMPIGGTLMAEDLGSSKTSSSVCVYASAPLMNFMLFWLFLALGLARDSLIFNEIAYANGILAFFSLLPVYPLDGGSILKALLSARLNERHVLTVLLWVNTAVSILLIGVFVYCYIKFDQILWQFLSIAVLFVYSTLRERANSSANNINDIINKDNRLKRAGIMYSDRIFILETAPLKAAIHAARHNRFSVFAVTDAEFNVLCELTEKDILELAMKYGAGMRICDAVRQNKVTR